jgi:hypothetical protein
VAGRRIDRRPLGKRDDFLTSKVALGWAHVPRLAWREYEVVDYEDFVVAGDFGADDVNEFFAINCAACGVISPMSFFVPPSTIWQSLT